MTKRKEATPRTSSNTSAYATPIPVSEAPNKQQAPVYTRPPNTDKKLPPHPSERSADADSTAIELPGCSPNLYEMPATHIPDLHPLSRPSTNNTSSDAPRATQQPPEHQPQSPYSTHSQPGQPASPSTSSHHPGTTSYAPSLRTPSERNYDPDEITPVSSANTSPYHSSRGAGGAAPNMYANVADALTDRKRMFERLRRANGDGQYGGEQQGFAGYSAPVEMEATHVVRQQSGQERAEEARARAHARNPSGPRELE